MIKYQYQIIRYLPDHFTGEFANIGIIIYAPERNFLSCRVTSRYSRLTEFFGEVPGTFLMSSLKHIESKIKSIGEDFNGLLIYKKNTTSIINITNTVVPPNDGSLQVSEVSQGIDIDPERALETLYQRIIEKYNDDGSFYRHTDEYAWRKVYKTYFDQFGITRKLKKHVVNTKKDEIKFDRAWKNGVWNCYQALSFDLKSADAIKNKAYKWSGIIQELQSTKEELKVFFLTTSPTEHQELESFIKSLLKNTNDHLEISVIEENQAEQFAKKVRADMEKSQLFGNDEFPF